MSLTTTGFALFLHISLVIIGLCLAAVLHTGLLLLRSSRDVGPMRPWPRLIAALEATLPLTALLILATGAWLLHLSGGEFAWSQGWVVASVVGLVAVEAAGALVGPRSAALRRAIAAAPDGAVAPELRRRVLDPPLWCVLHGGTSVFLAVVFLMVVKPSGAWSAVIVAAVGLVGASTGLLFARPRAAAPPVPEQRRVIDVTEPTETRTTPRA
jgi:hypothetical protein